MTIRLWKIKGRLFLIVFSLFILWFFIELKSNCEADEKFEFRYRNRNKNYRLIDYNETNLEKIKYIENPKNNIDFDKLPKISDNINELRYFIQRYIEILESLGEHQQLISSLKSSFGERTNVILADLTDLGNEEQFKNDELKKLSSEMYSKIDKLQSSIVNGTCRNAHVFKCDILDKFRCGFGCQIHHVVRCMIVAFHANLPMILKFNWPKPPRSSESFRIFDKTTWECEDYSQAKTMTSYMNKYPERIIPEPYLSRLKKFHSEPIAWWAGHFAAYLMRFSKEFEQRLKEKDVLSDIPKRCVGVHVRRTDKILEAKPHQLSEYMDQVAHYYDIQEIRQNNGDEIQKRCVFLATDEPEVINEAFEKYSKNYKFYVDNGAVEKASIVESRYGYDSTESTILDVFRLATCEFLVCTFSSNLCRLAYELMQTQFGDDASWRFSSLDDLYYFDGIRTSSFVARFDHKKMPNSDEIEFLKDDKIEVHGNHWNGYSKGKNLRTGETGLIPTFKLSKFY